MPKNRKRSQKSQIRRLAKTFGQWERRIISIDHPMRAALPPGERWRPDNYLNNRYSVQISDVTTVGGEIVHLWIRRHDGAPTRSWADFQRIKNEVVSPDRTAVEVFPAVDELVDSANMYHLWVLPAGFRLPFALAGAR